MTVSAEAVEAKHCPKCGSPDQHYVSGWSGIDGYYSCEVPK